MASVTVEIARTEDERNRGLMFRRGLEDGHGMLFVFERPQVLKFWMKDVLIPLDMIFIDENYQVVDIEESAEPGSLVRRGPDSPAQFVLEVPGGWARENDIEVGSTVRFF